MPRPRPAHLLLPLLLALAAGESPSLHTALLPHRAAAQNTLTPKQGPDGTPFRASVPQTDGLAALTLTLSLSPTRPTERLLSTHPPHQTRILSRATLSPPERNATSGAYTLSLRLRFRGRVGVARFQVSARTSDTRLLYTAYFEITVAGLSVLYAQRAISASFRNGFPLGAYDDWLEHQLALPLLAQPFSDGPGPLPDVHVSLALRAAKGATVAGVDSVRYDPVECREKGRVAVWADGAPSGKEVDTVFVTGPAARSLGKADMLPECGLAVSADGKWLLVRLEPYRVSGYAFGVEISVMNSTELSAFVVQNFYFDRAFVPPPLLLSLMRTLDPFGNEVLRVPVANAMNPPQTRDLRWPDFSLQLDMENGKDNKTISAFLVAPLPGAMPPLYLREVHFVTTVWKDQTVGKLLPSLSYRRPRHAEDENTGRPEAGVETGLAVLSPGHTISLTLASAKLAEIDSCRPDDKVYETGRYILVELDARRYNRSTFSQHKNKQIAGVLRKSFSGLSENGARLVSVEDKVVTYGLSILKSINETELSSSLRNLETVIVTDELSLQVHLRLSDLGKRNLSIINEPLCKKFPSHGANYTTNVNLTGIRPRFLPLWIALAITLATIIAVMLFRFICFVLHIQDVLLFSTGPRDNGTKEDLSAAPDRNVGLSSEDRVSGTLRRSATPTAGPVTGYHYQLPLYRGQTEFDEDVIVEDVIVEDVCLASEAPVPLSMSDVGSSTDTEAGLMRRVVDRVVNGVALVAAWCRRGALDGEPSLSSADRPDIYLERVWSSTE